MTTNAELKTIREYLAVPTEWLAERMGVTAQTVWKYERTERKRPIPEHATATLNELLAARSQALTRAVATYTDPAGRLILPRFADGAGWREAFPEFAGWPDSAQGSFLGELFTQADGRIEFVVVPEVE